MSPMSWVKRHPAERHVLLVEPCGLPRTLEIGEQVGVGQHHALGLAGRARRELDERRMVARQSCRRALARDVVEQVDEEGAGLSAVQASGSPCVAANVASRSRSLRSCRGTGCRAAGDAQQLLLVLVTDAHGHRHGHDATVDAGPEGVDELLVARHVQDQHVARTGADPLQVMEDAEARWRSWASGRAFSALHLEVADRAGPAAAVIEHFRGASGTGSSFFDSHVDVLRRAQVDARFECHRPGDTGRRRTRRAEPLRCSIISNIAKFSPMQCRGPAAKGR